MRILIFIASVCLRPRRINYPATEWALWISQLVPFELIVTAIGRGNILINASLV